jgi:hypothetical protein
MTEGLPPRPQLQSTKPAKQAGALRILHATADVTEAAAAYGNVGASACFAMLVTSAKHEERMEGLETVSDFVW